ncbi:hypothetical protein HC341_06245 [Aquisalimonas sp. 2447]|uniref:DUF2946 family protein n=1 Tax=Aquisalimonas sp. 2447 TaxID=2740807 RepID=UPI0014326E99|nr:hypothetical protein HC341_06245 [Aquisalimonas sp. 2447]
MLRLRWAVIVILVAQLLLGGAVHAHVPDLHDGAGEVAESSHGHDHHGDDTHDHHDHAAQCGLCGSCLAAAPAGSVSPEFSPPGEHFAGDPPGHPHHRIDTLLRPPRHLV